MANKPSEANFFPDVPQFPSMGTFQPVYGKFDLTTYIQGASDYEIMAFLVGKYNACLEAYGNITKLSTDTITACKQLQDWINIWFNNLDVQQELNNKIDSMVQDGSFGRLLHQTFDAQINQQTANATTAWLVANVTPTGSAVVVDKSLSIEGAAADAKASGDDIRTIQKNLNISFSTVKNLCLQVERGKVYSGGVGSTIQQSDADGYFCAKIEIPDGAKYLSTTIPVDMSPFSFFTDENLTVISDVISHLGNNYVYSVPANAKYLCGTHHISTLTDSGVVALATDNSIKRKYSVADFPYNTERYTGDKLIFNDGTKLETTKDVKTTLSRSFSTVKNLCLQVERGKVYSGGVGSTIQQSDADGYFCAKIEIPDGAKYLSTTIPVDMSPFSFFTDENLTVISDVISHLGNNYVYSVPANAKYLCGTHHISTLTDSGVVALATDNSIKRKYSVADFPYNTERYTGDKLIFNDGTKLETIKDAVTPLYVAKDGSGNFTRLIDAINEAEKTMGRTVYVGPGEWDIISELGNDYIESVSDNKRGIYLKNRIHLIFSSRATVVCKYTGNNTNTMTWLSAFNAGPYGFTLENCKIESENCRYAIHDERDSDADQYENVYKNCIISHTKKNGYDQCIGGGLGLDGHIVIEGCKFICPDGNETTQTVSYHNSGDGYWDNTESKGAQSIVDISNSYFSGTVAALTFGKSKKNTYFLIHGNSLGSKIEQPLEENPVIKVTAWNNEIRNK